MVPSPEMTWGGVGRRLGAGRSDVSRAVQCSASEPSSHAFPSGVQSSFRRSCYCTPLHWRERVIFQIRNRHMTQIGLYPHWSYRNTKVRSHSNLGSVLRWLCGLRESFTSWEPQCTHSAQWRGYRDWSNQVPSVPGLGAPRNLFSLSLSLFPII